MDMHTDAVTQDTATTASRVLLIEPNVQLRRAVQTLLELEGYLVWAARDVECGLAMLRTARWPLVALLSVSPADIAHGDTPGLLLRAVTTSGVTQWPQHAFLVATTSPEYLCALVDWLPEGLNLPVLRQPYNVDQLLRTVALTAYSLEIRQQSALRFLPPRSASSTAASLPSPRATPTPPATSTLASPSARGDTAHARTGADDRASGASAARADEALVLAADLRESAERMRACARQTRELVGHTASVLERGYVQHLKLVAAVERWRS